MVVVLPETVAEVQNVLAYCHENNVKVVARGAGTSLSGGALPLEDGVLISMMKFNRVKEIDFANRFAIVEPGVTNLAITRRSRRKAFITRPIRPPKSPARSGAMWRRIRAVCIA